MALALCGITQCHRLLGRPKEALGFARKADELNIKLFGERSVQRYFSLQELSASFRDLNDLKEAKEYALLREGIARASGDNELVASSLFSLARLRFDKKDYKSALSHCNEGLALVKPEDVLYLYLLNLMQTCYFNLEVDLIYCYFLIDWLFRSGKKQWRRV